MDYMHVIVHLDFLFNAFNSFNQRRNRA